MKKTGTPILFFNKYRLLELVVFGVFLVNCVFAFTYPINAGSYDYPNYLRMMFERVSNLIHASGYPAVMIVICKVLRIVPGPNKLDIEWLHKLQVIQVMLHSGLLLCGVVLCAKVFNRLAAGILCVIWGVNVLFMSGVNSAAPEWLMGDLTVLSFLLSAQAFVSPSTRRKIAFYSLSWLAFTLAYLVKFNILVLFPFLALVLLFDSTQAKWKLVAALASLVVSLTLLVSFVELYHYPTTRTRQLNYDHAWVLLEAIPETYFVAPPAQLGINSLRWMALRSVIPPDWSMAGAFCCIDTGAPPNERAPYQAKYREIMALSKDELIAFVASHPQPPGIIRGYSAIPIYWYVGLAEGDALGIAVFKESLLALPWTYVQRVIPGIALWSAYDKQTVPTYTNSLGQTFGAPAAGSGFVALSPPANAVPFFQPYWNPRQMLWRPGVLFFQTLAAVLMPRWLEVFILLCATIGVAISSTVLDKRFGLLCFLAIAAFSGASFILLGMRFKEFISIIPLIGLFYALGLSSLFARLYFSLRAGRSTQ